jgi:hypothetical protein
LYFVLTWFVCHHCFDFVFVLISNCPQRVGELINNKDEVMTIYEDEWAFWDDIAGKYILKHAAVDHNVDKVIDAAGVYADLMVLARRKRKRLKPLLKEVPVAAMPQV